MKIEIDVRLGYVLSVIAVFALFTGVGVATSTYWLISIGWGFLAGSIGFALGYYVAERMP